MKTNAFKVEALVWDDRPLGVVQLPSAPLTATLGLGSGLSRRAGDPAGVVWAISDRGPNLKPPQAIDRYGLAGLEHLRALAGAKVMPMPGLAPTICKLQVSAGRVDLVETLPLRTVAGRALSGLQLPSAGEGAMEPLFDLEGRPLTADPNGADPEAIVALGDGSFWVAEEYGPSLLKVSVHGVVELRWVPEGLALPGAGCPVVEALPRIARRRRLNRGFEGLAISPDETRLYVVFQSALESPGEPRAATRLWTLDARTGALLDEHLYLFDPPEAFRRDAEVGPVSTNDLKIGELLCVAPGRLLVLERISHTAKIQLIDLNAGEPTAKTLLLSTDDARQVAPDVEGMAMLSDRELLLTTDNDFGIEGASTQVYRVTFDRPFC